MSEATKEEKRIDLDKMSDPPLSGLIAKKLAHAVQDLYNNQEGHELNCLVVGKFTSNWACVISDTLPAAGGRVLCIGDSIGEDGKPLQSWLDVVGERFGKTVFPVSGDIGENYQGMDRKFDLVMFSCCGDYVTMATTISKWSGLLVDNGIACGSQLDKDDYTASTFAIVDIFGDLLSKDNGTTFWSAKVSRNVAKPV
tara:strand:- start:261 stop:851 length:591 start_codon:yes stop_codon:yes gene_type:complete